MNALAGPAPAAVDRCNRIHGEVAAETLLERALRSQLFGPAAVVSSFGADSAVLLHMTSRIDPATPVLFLDTGKHFEATGRYRDQLVTLLGLTRVATVTPAAAALAVDDPDGQRHSFDPDGCCELRKVRPLERALAPFAVWITGRRRDQSRERRSMARFEGDGAGRLKLNLLADWSEEAVAAYAQRHALPQHPLVAAGYRSIGCAPCTSPVRPGEPARAGRWRGHAKTECGLHGRLGRSQAPG